MSTLTLVVLGASREECAQSPVVASMADEVIFIANPDARWGGLGMIGNHYLDSALGDVLGIVHADTMLSYGVVVSLTQAASYSVAGIVGSVKGFDHAIWSAHLHSPQSVSTLDSCAMFVSRAVAHSHSLRFDVKTFDSFHCCVEDFCLQAAAAGLLVVVAPGSAGHPLQTTKFRRWEDGEHKRYRDALLHKWAQRGVTEVFIT